VVTSKEATMETRNETSSAGRTHPDLDEWVDYHHRRLAAEHVERLQEHLTRCRRCTTLVLGLQDLSEAEYTTPAPLEDNFMPRLLTQAIFSQTRARQWRNTALVAASLLVAVILPVAVHFKTLYPQGAGGGDFAEVNLPIVSLLPRSSLRGQDTNRLEIPATAKHFALVLTTQDPPSNAIYQLAISDALGRSIRSVTGLRPAADGTFRIGLPSHLLPSGNYHLELRTMSKGDRTLDDYTLEVVHPE